MNPSQPAPNLVPLPAILCPFCAGQQSTAVRMATNMYVIVCPLCKAQGPLAPTVEDAWEAWGWRGQRTWGTCPACQHWFRVRTPDQETCDGYCRRRLQTWRRKRDRQRLLTEAERLIQGPGALP